MDKLSYYLLYPFIWLTAVSPFWLVYLLADLLCFILYGLIKYRRDIVRQNLENAFPEKSPDEIKKIERDYYKFMSELMVENFKKMNMSKKESLKRCAAKGMELVNKFRDEGRPTVGFMTHVGNWEWSGYSFLDQTEYPLYMVYQPLSNKYFDDLMIRLRQKGGIRLIPSARALRDILKMKTDANFYGLIADQSPAPERAIWMNFMNQETGFIKGPAQISRKIKAAALFQYVRRVKRGYYELNFELLAENAADYTEEELTAMYAQRLEERLREQPENWLWSHRRWKHRRPEGMELYRPKKTDD